MKALSNDIQRNLEAPLVGIREALRALGLPDVEIRTWVRTGDTPAGERERMRRCPPHIVVTTPESLYILLGSASGRRMLATTRTVIVDEIHALAPNKRGAHLALSLERLESLCGERLLRVGLSATQKPIETTAHFLVGATSDGAPADACTIIDTGHRRARDLALEVPSSPLEAVMSNDVWQAEEPGELGKVGDEGVGHAVTEIFLLRVVAHVDERQHDDGGFVGQRKRRWRGLGAGGWGLGVRDGEEQYRTATIVPAMSNRPVTATIVHFRRAKPTVRASLRTGCEWFGVPSGGIRSC